jgi:guanylate kinase
MEASLVIQEQMKSTLYNMTVPVTTRPMADGEEQGRDYFFVAVLEFEEVGQIR